MIHTAVDLRDTLTRPADITDWCVCPLTSPCQCGRAVPVRPNTNQSTAQRQPWVVG